MADRFPLIANSSANQIQELAASDNLNITSSSLVSSGIVTVSAPVDISKDIIVGAAATITGVVDLNSTTDSTSSTTGALQIAGGVGIAKNVYIGAGLSVAGTLTYEDVTNVDSVGLITAKSGVNITGGQLQVGVAYSVGSAGVATAAGFVGPLTGNVTGTASNATNFTVADESSDTTCFPVFVTAATGDLPPKSGSNLTFNSSTGALTAGSFVGNINGNVTGNLNGTVNTGSQTNITSLGTLTGLTVSGNTTLQNLTVNGTETVINTNELHVTDKTIGIGSTSSPSDTLADDAGIIVYGTTDKKWFYDNDTKGWNGNIPLTLSENRVKTQSEKVVRADGNTISLVYGTSGTGNVAIATNPTGDITLAVTSIPTSSDFNTHCLTFSCIVNNTGTARTVKTVTLNGTGMTIKWAGGNVYEGYTGFTTTTGQTIYSFSAINLTGDASSMGNYTVLGTVSGGYF